MDSPTRKVAARKVAVKKVVSKKKAARKVAAPISELQKLIQDVSKKRGTTVIRPGNQILLRPQLATGIFPFDYVTYGGLIEGVCHMVFGGEAKGKTLFATLCMIAAQRKYPGQYVAFVDREGTYDNIFAERLGLDLSRMLYVDAENGEEAVDLVEGLVKTKEVCFTVLDSIPALSPSAIVEASADDDTVGKLAALCGKMMSKLLTALAMERRRHRFPTVMFINQLRDSIGGIPRFGFIPDKLPGGRQLKFQTFGHLDIRKKEFLTEDCKGVTTESPKEIIFNRHTFRVARWKTALLSKIGEYDVVLNDADPRGFGFVDGVPALITVAEKDGYITGAGRYWRIVGYNDKNSNREPFGSKEALTDFLYANQEFRELLGLRLILHARQKMDFDLTPPDGYLGGKYLKDPEALL